MPELKKTYLIILFSFFFVQAARAQYESLRNPLSVQEKQMVNRYKVKSMKMWISEKSGDSLIQFMEYSKDGLLMHTLSDGVNYTYQYDKKGNATVMNDSFTDEETGKVNKDTFRFEYDKNGYLSHARLNGNSSVFRYDPRTYTLVEQKTDTAWPELIINSYTYNVNRDIVELHVQDPLSNSVTFEKISYTKDHKMLTDTIVIQSQTEDTDSISTSYTYDSKGNKAEEESLSISFTGQGRSSRTVKRQDFYDSESRLIEEFVFENGMEKERFVYSYSGTGYEPVSESFFSKGYLQRVDTYQLDPKTGLPMTLVEEETGTVKKFRYEFQLY